MKHSRAAGWRGLYAIIDVDACGTRSPLSVASAVLEGGCAALQLRAKAGPDAALESLARALRERCSAAGVPFIINDYLPLALDVRADGLHLGQDDLTVVRARRLAPNLIIGLSTHNDTEIAAATNPSPDLIGFGPIFATTSKHDPAPVLGLAKLAEVSARMKAGDGLPIVAIGGIDRSNVHLVAQTGVPMAACIGALCKASDPRAAAAELHRALTAR